MRPISFIALFSSCVSTLVLQPLITPAPQLAGRDAAPNICGYYSLFSSIETISCGINTPCLIATNVSPAVGYCSGTDIAPLTTVYPFGSWPSDQGCGPGEGCCPLSLPAAGEYLFNGGSTVFLGCGSTSFTLTAFFPTPIPKLISAATPTSTPAGTTSNPNFALTTSPALGSTATATTPRPSQTGSSSSSSGSTTLIVVIVGAVVALISGVIFLWFIYMAWRVHHKAKYPQQPQYPYQYSNPSLNSVPQVKNPKGSLSKWAKIITIVSPIFAVAGLIVSIYFGLRQK